MSCNSKCQKFRLLLEKILIIQLLLLLHFKIICAILFLIVENIYKIYCLTSFFSCNSKEKLFLFISGVYAHSKRTCLQCWRPGFDPWVGKNPWRRAWLPTPVFLLGEFHRLRSLASSSPWGC